MPIAAMPRFGGVCSSATIFGRRARRAWRWRKREARRHRSRRRRRRTMPSLPSWQPPARRAPGGGFSPSAMTLTIRTSRRCALQRRHACQAVPRCAADPACNASAVTRWVIAFGSAPGDDGGWCWDTESGAARASVSQRHVFGRVADDVRATATRRSRTLASSPSRARATPLQLAQCAGAVVLVRFVRRPRAKLSRPRKALGAIAALRPMMDAAGADSVISGGAGVMSLLPDLRAALPPRAIVSECATAACSSTTPTRPKRPAARRTTRTRAVPPRAAASHAAVGFGRVARRVVWNRRRMASSDAPASCREARRATRACTATAVRRTRRAHASLSAEEVRSRLEAALAAADVAVGSACAAPAEALTRAAFTSVTFGRGLPPPSMAAGLLALVSNTTPATPLVDDCRGVGCNVVAERSPYHVPMGTGLPNTLYGYVYGATAKAATQQCTDAALTAEDVAHYRPRLRRAASLAQRRGGGACSRGHRIDDSLSSDETTIMLNDDAGANDAAESVVSWERYVRHAGALSSDRHLDAHAAGR